MTEQPSYSEQSSRAPEGSLQAVRETFGTLLVDRGASVALQPDYRGHGDRILINTTAEGIRGPKTGSSHEGGKPGSAFIDLALTPELAKSVYEGLGRALAEYQENYANK